MEADGREGGWAEEAGIDVGQAGRWMWVVVEQTRSAEFIYHRRQRVSE